MLVKIKTKEECEKIFGDIYGEWGYFSDNKGNPILKPKFSIFGLMFNNENTLNKIGIKIEICNKVVDVALYKDMVKYKEYTFPIRCISNIL